MKTYQIGSPAAGGDGRFIVYQSVGRSERSVGQFEGWQEANQRARVVLLDSPGAEVRIADRMEFQAAFDRILSSLGDD